MREIKFRVWDSLGEEMIYDKMYLDLNGELYNRKFKAMNEPFDLIILQYTGLKDKNGKEIYEGDIVKLTDGYKVYWSSKKCGWDLMNVHYDKGTAEIHIATNCDIIGNIYENPELLDSK